MNIYIGIIFILCIIALTIMANIYYRKAEQIRQQILIKEEEIRKKLNHQIIISTNLKNICISQYNMNQRIKPLLSDSYSKNYSLQIDNSLYKIGEALDASIYSSFIASNPNLDYKFIESTDFSAN